jgi:hypothetical protein
MIIVDLLFIILTNYRAKLAHIVLKEIKLHFFVKNTPKEVESITNIITVVETVLNAISAVGLMCKITHQFYKSILIIKQIIKI